MVTVDALVFAVCGEGTKVLLVRRGQEPFAGLWAVPGGFVEMDEELEDAALRELAEETGLRGVKLEQMHTFGTVGRDPRGRQITICFIGFVSECGKIAGGDDADEAKWWDINALPEKLAFDHNEVVVFGIRELKKKIKEKEI